MFATCLVSVGLMLVCQSTSFTGIAPVLIGEHVRSCRIVMGHVATCAFSYTGDVVLPRGVDGKYVSCTVQSGNITHCDITGFTGTSILWRLEL